MVFWYQCSDNIRSLPSLLPLSLSLSYLLSFFFLSCLLTYFQFSLLFLLFRFLRVSIGPAAPFPPSVRRVILPRSLADPSSVVVSSLLPFLLSSFLLFAAYSLAQLSLSFFLRLSFFLGSLSTLGCRQVSLCPLGQFQAQVARRILFFL